MGSIVFYKGQPIKSLSREELVIALTELGEGKQSTVATGTVRMSKAEAINLGFINPK